MLNATFHDISVNIFKQGVKRGSQARGQARVSKKVVATKKKQKAVVTKRKH